jgi:phage-related tail protein
LGDVETKAKSSGGVLGGLGGALGGLVSPLGLATLGVGALTGFLAGATKAAIDEQKNIAKLDASLAANVAGWDGNRDAIEGVIATRTDLAFSDDDLRASMSVLVTSTGDVNEALDLQALAMDLARAKGVDLETASTAIAKASQGSTKELKAMGIELTEGATASENLAVIQKATAGQAEAYAKTMSGKWETFNNKLGDVVENIGSALLPIIEGVMDFLLTTVIPTFSEIANLLGPVLKGAIDVLGGAFKIMGKAIGWAIDTFVKPAIDIVKGLIGFVKDALKFLGILQDEPPPVNYSTQQRTPGYAHGGTTQPGMAWVGEQGPELVRFSGGQTVYSASQSSAMAQGGGQPVELAINIDGREIGRVVDHRLRLIYSGATGARS